MKTGKGIDVSAGLILTSQTENVLMRAKSYRKGNPTLASKCRYGKNGKRYKTRGKNGKEKSDR